jgi:hypothetical protein
MLPVNFDASLTAATVALGFEKKTERVDSPLSSNRLISEREGFALPKKA